jgi:acyl-coenzyme A thioesterase PaaI-like protein
LHLHFYNSASGEVTAEVTLPEPYQGYPGIAHGGIIAAMLDEAAGRSQMGDSAAPRFMFTARLQINYRKNVPTGQPLRLVGRAGEAKRRTAAATAFLFGPDGSVLAEADALLVNVPDDMLASANLEDIGWKVYPDEAIHE